MTSTRTGSGRIAPPQRGTRPGSSRRGATAPPAMDDCRRGSRAGQGARAADGGADQDHRSQRAAADLQRILMRRRLACARAIRGISRLACGRCCAPGSAPSDIRRGRHSDRSGSACECRRLSRSAATTPRSEVPRMNSRDYFKNGEQFGHYFARHIFLQVVTADKIPCRRRSRRALSRSPARRRCPPSAPWAPQHSTGQSIFLSRSALSCSRSMDAPAR